MSELPANIYTFTQGETVRIGVSVPGVGPYQGSVLSPSKVRTDTGDLAVGSGGTVDVVVTATEHGVYQYRVENEDFAFEGSFYVSPSDLYAQGSGS